MRNKRVMRHLRGSGHEPIGASGGQYSRGTLLVRVRGKRRQRGTRRARLMAGGVFDMHAHRIVTARTLGLVLAFLPWMAHAYFFPPWIPPSKPQAGDTVYININGVTCGSTFTTLGYTQILQEDKEIRFIVSGDHGYDLNWCIYGEGTFTRSIGTYPPGT